MSPARRCAYAVVRRVFEDDAFADRALHGEARTLGPRDRALATAMAYGTVQRKRTLDHLLAPLLSRPLDELDPPVLAALRLGVYQLTLMGGIAEYAAVNESVELVKASGRGGARMVNAVLRRAAREAPKALAALNDATVTRAAVLHSVPDWIAETWWEELGPDETRALLARSNQPPESAIRVNPLRAPDTTDLPVRSHAVDDLPEARVLDEPFDAFGSEMWRAGAIMPQSRGSMLVSRSLGPRAGERVLDLCAAPGAKTTHLAALMEGQGEIVAVEVNPGRARSLAATCVRMGADLVRVVNVDGRQLPPEGRFDRVLVDPPCSGLGTLQARPDLRWQAHRSHLDELTAKQAALLRAGANALAPDGTLVYSVCTITQTEGPGVVQAFLTERPEFSLTASRQLLPHRDGTDGFFIATLRLR